MNAGSSGGVFRGASFLVALVLGTTLAQFSTVTPQRVIDLCGEPPIPTESLCNVDESLHGAFLLIERAVANGADGLPLLSQIPAVVHTHLVSVEWYPDSDPGSTRKGLMGMYDESSRRVMLPRALEDEPVRVWASVIAHELAHATLRLQGVGADKRPSVACFENEAQAFKAGMVVYERTRRVDREPLAPAGDVDGYLDEQVSDWQKLSGGGPLTAAALNDLANRHVFLNGYDIDCSWR